VTALATVDQLQARLGTGELEPTDLARAEAVLEDASQVVRDVAKQPDWDDQTVPAGAVQIVLAVSVRAFRNPDGLTRQRLGDAEWGYYRGAEPGVYLTEQEMDRLTSTLTSSGFRVMTNEVWPTT
jgi:hypothetical protein